MNARSVSDRAGCGQIQGYRLLESSRLPRCRMRVESDLLGRFSVGVARSILSLPRSGQIPFCREHEVAFRTIRSGRRTSGAACRRHAASRRAGVFDVLRYLIENRDRVVTRGELLDEVWSGRIVSESALSSRIKDARVVIGDSGARQEWIKTIHGRGFRFVGDVKADSGEAKAPPGALREPQQHIQYCRTTDGIRIAFAETGGGPTIVKAANWMSHLEYDLESPIWRHWINELSHGHRLIRYDERGNGLSDREVSDLSFEAMVADLESVVEALDVDRFALFGISQGCAVSVEYAVRHPDRVSSSHLVRWIRARMALARSHRDRQTHCNELVDPGGLGARQSGVPTNVHLTLHAWRFCRADGVVQ